MSSMVVMPGCPLADDDADWVNSDPDAELAEPGDDTIGADWDEMSDFDLDGADDEADEDAEA